MQTEQVQIASIRDVEFLEEILLVLFAKRPHLKFKRHIEHSERFCGRDN